MKVWKTLKTWLSISCICFTVITLLMLLLALTDSKGEQIVRIAQVLRTFPCALVMGFAFVLFKTEKIARWARVLLHYILCVGSVFAFLYLPVALSDRAVTALLMFVLFSVLYWILFGIAALIVSRVRILMEKD